MRFPSLCAFTLLELWNHPALQEAAVVLAAKPCLCTSSPHTIPLTTHLDVGGWVPSTLGSLGVADNLEPELVDK